jgi:hypothetical protein
MPSSGESSSSQSDARPIRCSVSSARSERNDSSSAQPEGEEARPTSVRQNSRSEGDVPRRVTVTSLRLNPPPIRQRSASSSVRRRLSASSGASAARRQRLSHRSRQFLPNERGRGWNAVRGAERLALGSCASSCRTLGSGVYAVRSDYRGRGEGDARVGEREADEVVILGVSVVDELLDDRLWGLKPGLGLPGWRGERDRRERDVQGELAAAGRRGRVQRAGDEGEAEGREARRSPSGASGGETSCQLRPSRREHRPRRTGTRSISGRVSVGERCLSLGDDAGGRS